MTRRFGRRWIRCRSKMDGVRFIGTISTVVTTTGTTMAGGRHATRSTGPARTREDFLQHNSIHQPLKQAMQFFAESQCGAGPAPQRHEARQKNTSITTKAWRQPFDETQMEHEEPAARTASIHQCHELFFRHDAGPKVRPHRVDAAMMRPGQASLQPPRSWRQWQIFKREY